MTYCLCNGPICAVLCARCSYDRRNQIVHLFLVAPICSKQSGRPTPVLAGGSYPMKRMCNEAMTQTWRKRQLAVTDLLRHAKIVTDPNTLEYLNAQVAPRRASAEGDRPRAR